MKERKRIFEKNNISFDHPNLRDVESAVKSTKETFKCSKNISKKKIHILHLSTSDEVDLLRSNKNIATCEATPQHLFFSAPECYEKLGSLAQMNPPIRDFSHTEGIWDGVSDKVIDVIGSDHAPHTIEEKKKYPDSPSGMTGVQTLLPIMLDFVNKKKLSIFDLVRLVCSNPCKIYNVVNKGQNKSWL